jgi:hypothetical protein
LSNAVSFGHLIRTGFSAQIAVTKTENAGWLCILRISPYNPRPVSQLADFRFY